MLQNNILTIITINESLPVFVALEAELTGKIQ